jgi:hypothetical protein
MRVPPVRGRPRIVIAELARSEIHDNARPLISAKFLSSLKIRVNMPVNA